jgi:hypothetical protein
MPKHLRGVSGYNNDYQQALELKANLQKTAMEETKPVEWERLTRRIDRRYLELKTKTDQTLWKNYKGVRAGPIKDSFRTKF